MCGALGLSPPRRATHEVRRILPSPRKGGSRKTTFATNFALALSRSHQPFWSTLTPALLRVRNTIDAPVERDLYHFFRRGEPLDRCLTRLPERLDLKVTSPTLLRRCPRTRWRSSHPLRRAPHPADAGDRQPAARVRRPRPARWPGAERSGFSPALELWNPVFTPITPPPPCRRRHRQGTALPQLRLLFATDGRFGQRQARPAFARSRLARPGGRCLRREHSQPRQPSCRVARGVRRGGARGSARGTSLRSASTRVETCSTGFASRSRAPCAVHPSLQSTSPRSSSSQPGWIVTSPESQANCERFRSCCGRPPESSRRTCAEELDRLAASWA